MLIGVTQGDSSGIGPEIILKSHVTHRFDFPVVVYGDKAALDYYNDQLGLDVSIRTISRPAEFEPGPLNLIDAGLLRRHDIRCGQLDRASGAAARAYVVSATVAALAGEIGAIVTLPVNKEAVQLSNPTFVGHTELIGELCGVKDVTIMLVSDQLIVTHVSTHVSLATAIARAKKDRICTILRMTSEAMRRLVDDPKIAVAGLNPHAGESGLFGDEEINEIAPAVEWAKSQGMPVDGPFPPDTVFYMAVHKKKFNAVVCMYHDQGHIPSKLLDFEGGVNVSLGLPIIRTSVDHGTAFDIAGKGNASIHSFIRATELAIRLSRATSDRAMPQEPGLTITERSRR
jgi:4-phospho-D-threonate 3-dehydrogenase / 4-phospho-D-erythronate 3-dehydrogenase